jgi:AcrR family transcriptional regulator
VDAIVEAAAYILERHGWDRLTTNRIAERAGVNIGSLYQYFPNKEAILAEIERRFLTGVHSDMASAAPSLGELSLANVLRLGVKAALAAVAPHRELQRAFFEELPKSARPSPVGPGIDGAWRDWAVAQMHGVPDPELALFVWDAVMDGVVRAVVCVRPDLLDDPRLADEVGVLLERYLVRGRTA